MVEGIIIVPTWDRKSIDKIWKLVEEESLIHKEYFSKGQMWDVSASMEELINAYGKSVIKKAKKIGEKVKANACILYPTRGFGKLEITAHYFRI